MSPRLLGGTPWTPVFAPASIGHVAFPLSFQAGEVGFRAPGLGIYQRVPMGGEMAIELGIMVVRSVWRAPVDVVATVPDTGSAAGAAVIPEWTIPFTSAGETSGFPAVEGLVQLSSKTFRISVSGHYGRIHRAGFGVEESPAATDLAVAVVQAHARLSLGPVTLLGGAPCTSGAPGASSASS